MNKIILVTGGSGFVGSHLCRLLIEKEFEVRVIDFKYPVEPIEDVHYITGDCRNKPLLEKAVHGAGAVFHFAATTSVPICQHDPYDSTGNNVMTTLDVLEAVRHEIERQRNPVRFIYSGSSVVYGLLGKKNKALREDIPLEDPLSFYGAQKLASEQAVRLYVKTFGIEAVVFRFFNLYGTGQAPDSPYSGVITKFIASAKNNLPLNLNAGGYQTRDFVAVEDVAEACLKTLSLPAKLCDGMPINLGTGKSVTIRELATVIKEISKSKSPLAKTPPRQADVPYSLADISRAGKVLKWKPRIKLEEGLKKLIKGA